MGSDLHRQAATDALRVYCQGGAGSGFDDSLRGAALIFPKTVNPRKAIGAFAGAFGVLAIAFPTYLTGMCAVACHSCRTTTEPAPILAELATAVVGIGPVLMKQK